MGWGKFYKHFMGAQQALHRNFMNLPARNVYDISAVRPDTQQTRPFILDINTTQPPLTDPPMIAQRLDEVNTIQRMLNDAHTSAVMIVGSPGAGKSTLAALLYRRLQLAKKAGLAAPRHLVWLGIGAHATLTDIITAILNAVNVKNPGLFLLKPEQQIALLLHALRRPEENALIVLDQFEMLLQPAMNQELAEHRALTLFLDMLQNDLGSSRFLLTGYVSPYDQPDMDDTQTRVRSYLASHISMPEGRALLQYRGVQGSPEDLSLVWQRCSGHTFALILFAALVNLSGGISISYFLHSPDYQPMWAGEVTSNLVIAVYHFFNPLQIALMRSLSLFNEPVPLQGIIMTITGSNFPVKLGQHIRLEQALDTLLQLSLVQQLVNSTGTTCYMLHPLLSQYALEHYSEGNDPHSLESAVSPNVVTPLVGVRLEHSNASNPGFRISSDGPEALQAALAAGHMRAAAYYQYVARKHCPPREQRKGVQDLAAIIFAIRHLCLGWHWQRAYDLLSEEGLHESMMQWGAWNVLIGLYLAMLPPAGILLRRDEGLVACLVGILYGRKGEHQQSQSYFEQALAIQRQIGDLQGEATTLTNQGELLRAQGMREQARSNFERALSLNEQRPDLFLRSLVLHNLGLLYHEERNYNKALNCYLQALESLQGRRGQQNRGLILTNMGMLLYEQGQQKEALAVLLAALQLRQSLQDPAVPLLENFLHALEQQLG